MLGLLLHVVASAPSCQNPLFESLQGFHRKADSVENLVVCPRWNGVLQCCRADDEIVQQKIFDAWVAELTAPLHELRTFLADVNHSCSFDRRQGRDRGRRTAKSKPASAHTPRIA